MYSNDLCTASTEPTFATAGLDPVTFAEMERDLQELKRIEAAITPEELDEMERMYRAAQPKNETRVSVAGRRYKAEARLAGERWVSAGSHASEDAAWRAASNTLAGLVNGMRQTA